MRKAGGYCFRSDAGQEGRLKNGTSLRSLGLFSACLFRLIPRETLQAAMLLRPHICFFQIRHPNPEENPKKQDAAYKKRQGRSGQYILVPVGIHSKEHQRIGIVQPPPGAGGQDAAHPGQQGESDGQGKISDHGSQAELECGDGQSAKRAPKEPYKGLDGRQAWQARKPACRDVQHSHIGLGQQGNAGDGQELGGVQAGERNRRAHQSVAVMVKVFQPPQIAAVDGDQRRKEEVGIEQGGLCP